MSSNGEKARPCYRVLGTRVDVIQLPEAVEQIVAWAAEKSGRYYIVTPNSHVVTESRRDPEYRQALEHADLCLADGYPIRLVGRLLGYPMRRRCSGPDVMLEVIRRSVPLGLGHFFYGGAPGLPEELAQRLAERFPGLRVAGAFSPPLGPVTPVEKSEVINLINRSGADFVWVALGLKKQETWMYWRRPLLKAPVLMGVGAAFDFHAGRIPRAPEWMRDHGLEWFHRLCTEPRRLWKRYLIVGGEFGVRLLTDIATGHCRKIHVAHR